MWLYAEEIEKGMPRVLVNGVAQTIKAIRNAKKISQEDLAEKSSLDRTYISGVERGVRNITLDSLESIIYGLDLEPSDFLEILKSHLCQVQDIN